MFVDDYNIRVKYNKILKKKFATRKLMELQ